MRYIKNVFVLVLIAVTLLIGIGYLICAYSPYISPVAHPYWACAGLFFPIFVVLVVLCIVAWLILKPRIAVLPVVILLVGCGSLRLYCPFNFSKSTRQETIKFLSYNTEGLQFGGENGADTVLSYLRASNADIICLQEFIPDAEKKSQRKIKEALSEYPYSNITKTKGGDRLACFSRFPILSATQIEYKSQFNGSILYKLKMGEDTLVVVNNHLESNKIDTKDKIIYNDLLKSPREEKIKTDGKYLLKKLAEAVLVRAPQVDSVAQAIKENRSRYMLVCGDFNDSPISYAHHKIGSGMTDAFSAAGTGFGFSYNQNRFYFRIDHIFSTPAFRVVKCEVDRSIKASDHYPIWCLLEK